MATELTSRVRVEHHAPIMRRLAPLALLPCLAATGCFLIYGRTPLELPPTPVALEAVNSPFDDYNAAMPDVAGGELVFATNRASAGGQFDLFRTMLHFSSDDVDAEAPSPLHGPVNSTANELGPFFEPGQGRTVVFASDRPGGVGGLDLYSWHEGEAPRALTALNSPFDDAYFTAWDAPDDRIRPALFASNRGGQGFDAYEVAMNSGEAPTRVEALSTPHDETAFYAFSRRGSGRYVVFASNRPGGRGDFDLFCSAWTSSGFGPPTALAVANTPAKEFRPIVIEGNFSDVLVFSSNRPGGQGGMDLYYVAFDNPCAARSR